MEEELRLENLSLHEPKEEVKKAPRTSSSSSHIEDSELKEKFMKLVAKARKCAENGDMERAIKLNEKALEIRHSEKLEKRIIKMKQFLAEQAKSDGEDDDDSGMRTLGKGFMVHKSIADNLYNHQREGVLWMWSLHQMSKGGILADDMGLGKTIQVIAFLAGLFDMDLIQTVLIVVPLSVLPNWANEFKKWTPGITITPFHGSSKKECERGLARVRTRGGVVLTTYGLIVTREIFTTLKWDYVILDEGHRIKNPTKTSKSMHNVPAKQRLILTGTPVQNNLKELWSLFDYVHQGSLLGTVRTFKLEFEGPIVRARERDASAVEKRLGQEMADTLKSIIQPYFLRRTKAQVSKNEAAGDGEGKGCIKMPTMTRKNDFVVWLFLSETQQQIYRDFISLDDIKELLMTKKSPLVALTVLKKICDHPRLLSTRACLQLGLDGENFDEELLEHPQADESAANQIAQVSDEVLVAEAGKMQFLVALLDQLKQEGHRTLIFSQSRRLLNIIQKVITNRGHKVIRLDGTINSLTERDSIVQKFQKDPSYTVFLLTLQVGGVGLTITAADRVVIYDPSWNPANDAQAVDRAFRIGQNKNVVVYRLITCGTVEEKIYRRQVFKDSITMQTTGSTSNPYRYFTKMELRELFSLDDPRDSKTQRQLQDMHATQRNTDQQLDEHIAFIHSLDVFGISDHDLMFSQTHMRDDEEDDDDHGGDPREEDNDRFIKHRIKKAQALLAEESEIPTSFEERSKGGMKYPSRERDNERPPPPPQKKGEQLNPKSGLFSEVGRPMYDDVAVISDSVEAIDVSEEGSEQEPIDISDINGDEEEDSSAVTKPNPEPERKVLQPLTAREVEMRSPQVALKGQLINEELLISPDGSSPLIGLGKISARRRMLEDQSGTGGSYPSSPSRKDMVMGSPRRILNSPRNSPHKSNPLSKTPAIPASPKSGAKAALLLSGDSGVRPSPQRVLFPSSTPKSGDIFVPESPDLVDSPAPQSANSSLNDSLSVCRKLAFDVADTPQVSPSPAQDPNLSSPLAKKLRALSSSPRPGYGHSESIKSENAVGSGKKLDISRRRSVCLKREVKKENSPDEMEDDDLDSEKEDNLFENLENEGDDDENDVIEESESEDDKENLPVLRRIGGRNRLISESSESGSCFEVEESEEEEREEEEEGVKVKEEDERRDRKEEAEDEGALVRKEGAIDVSDVQDSSVDMQGEDAGSEEEELDEEEREKQEMFENFVKLAKAFYKQKEFQECLVYVEQALAIIPDPDLQNMATKVRLRAAEQKLNEEVATGAVS